MKNKLQNHKHNNTSELTTIPHSDDNIFKCPNNFKCFKGNRESIVCDLSPCEINKFKFGTHDMIIENFLQNDDLDNAYIYIQNLIPLFNFSCSVDEIDKIKREKPDLQTRDYPIGCRIFVISREMKEHRRRIAINVSKDGTIKTGLCTAEIDIIKENKIDLAKKISSVFELLKHASIAKRNEIEDQKFYFEKSLILLDKTIEAKEKYNVETKQPDTVEQAVQRAKEGSGFSNKDKEEQDFNRERLKKADIKEKREKLTKLIQDKIIKSNGTITPEIQELIKEIQRLEG